MPLGDGVRLEPRPYFGTLITPTQLNRFIMSRILLLVGLGGLIGSIARYLVSILCLKIFPFAFPYGTLIVNLIGCFLIGLLYGFMERNILVSPEWRGFLMTGICGGFTTFSAFSLESVVLLRQENYLYFGVYISLSIILGIGATILGIWIVKI